MNTAMTIAASALVSAGVAIGAVLVMNEPTDRARLDSGVDARAVVELEGKIEAQENEIAALRDALRRQAAQTPAVPRPFDEERVRAIVVQMMGETRDTVPAAAGPETAAATSDEAFEAMVRKLADEDLDWEERQKIWTALMKAGRFEEAIAWFEAEAERRSNDPDAQVMLANAYLARLNSGEVSHQEMGVLGNKADALFNRALEIDPEHWEARFTKAVSLSFWPPVLGKQPEAIRNFEILLEQQARQPKQEEFAQTHLLLGNIYFQQGDKTKAKEVWQKGLQAFPQNETLKAQIEAAGD